MLPDETAIVSGTYRPAGYGSLESAGNWGLPASFIVNHPAPGGTATLDSVFGGLFIGGNWTLIVRDDFTADAGSLASWGLQGTAAVIVKPDDFDGNFQSDILWQGSDGTPAVWLISGDHVVSVGAAGSSILGRPGTSGTMATSTATAGPTSCGRTTTARPRSG